MRKMPENTDFRHQGLTVAFDELERNIKRPEEDMAMLRQRQSVVSDEVQHEVEEALNAADTFLLSQKANFTGRWTTCLAAR